MTWLYHCYDKKNSLLYVGVSDSAVDRLLHHKHCSRWGKIINKVSIMAEFFAESARKRWAGKTKAEKRAFAMKGVKARAKRRNGG